MGIVPTMEIAWYHVVLACMVLLTLLATLTYIAFLLRQQRRLRANLEEQLAERRRAGAALEQDRNLLRTLVDNLPDFVFVKDTQSRFLLSNAAHRQYLGVQRDEDILGKTDFAFFTPPIAQKFYDDEQHCMLTGEALIARDEPAINAQGKRIWVSTTKVAFRDRYGHVVGIVGMSRDITAHKLADDQIRRANRELDESRRKLLDTIAELQRSHADLKAAQLQLIQAEKMDSVGTLAAGVAHEVKNPLQTILMGVDFIATRLPKEDETIAMVLSEMQQAVERADTITRGLLDFSASRELNMVNADLNVVVRQALRLVHHQLLRHHVRVTEELVPGLPEVRLDKQKIEQVFVNLFVNAMHAIGESPTGGAITVRTSIRVLDTGARQEGSRRAERFRAGDTVVVAEVEDTGPGIPEAYLARIFDPFFTTKPTGKGTGLGLSVARKILELHNATIDVRNRPNTHGVRVVLMFKALTPVDAAPLDTGRNADPQTAKGARA